MIPAMKTDPVTKFLLAVIAVALVYIAGQGALNLVTPVHAATAGSAFEYKYILKFTAPDWNSGYFGGTATWLENGNQPPEGFSNDETGLGKRFQALGADGWELVSDVAISNHINVAKLNDSKTNAMNGVTTSERFMFKRKK
jgi:hypothetical protein